MVIVRKTYGLMRLFGLVHYFFFVEVPENSGLTLSSLKEAHRGFGMYIWVAKLESAYPNFPVSPELSLKSVS